MISARDNGADIPFCHAAVCDRAKMLAADRE
jgi:hypothetical protein